MKVINHVANAGIAVALLVAQTSAFAAEDVSKTSLQELVDESAQVVTDFTNAPKMDTFRELAKKAKGVFISPKVTTLGFVVAGSSGKGLVMLRDDGNEWGQPAFYRYKEGSVGLQAGGKQAAVILLLMTDKGVEAMLQDKIKLGAGLSVAAGPIGGGTTQSMKTEADIISYTMSEGLFAGVALSGGQMSYRNGWNNEYYDGTVAGVESILKSNAHSDPGTAALREAMGKLGM
ncbi:MAG: hypothetical protein DHS20C01_21400 [marine bacterium B5-7]|nr:MAG: hypothetical protein DHS20C01_21400 [marine bacterium B5-7]